MIIIVWSLLFLGAGAGFFCFCRDEKNGYKVQMTLVGVGVLCLVMSYLGFGVFLGGTFSGYPVEKGSLTTNAVYEIVVPGITGKDNKSSAFSRSQTVPCAFLFLSPGTSEPLRAGSF